MDIVGINPVDVVLAAIVLLSAFFAFYRGFLREALAIAGWIGAGAVTWRYFADAREWLAPYIAHETLLSAAAGGGVFLGSLVVFWLAIHFIVARVQNSPLNALDRSLGFLFGLARGVAVIALLFLFGRYTFWNEGEKTAPGWLTGAASYTLIAYSADMIDRAIPDDLLGLPEAAPSDLLLAQPPVASDDTGGGEVYADDPARLLDSLPTGDAEFDPLPDPAGEGG